MLLAFLDDPRIRYIKLDRKLSIGEKRNICCESAKGKIIAHFDDDDWSCSDRLEEQVRLLKETGKQVTGYHSLSYYDINSRKGFQYLGGKSDGSLRGSYACGASQCYLKSYWQINRFGDVHSGEDSQFANHAKSLGVLDSVDGLNKLVALRHSTNTWTAENKSTDWKSVGLDALPSEFIKEFPKVSIVITTFNRPRQLARPWKAYFVKRTKISKSLL